MQAQAFQNVVQGKLIVLVGMVGNLQREIKKHN
jgi:hypothetical protein